MTSSSMDVLAIPFFRAFKKNSLAIVLAVFVTIVLLWLLLRQVDLREVGSALSSLPLSAIIIAFLFYIIVHIFRTWRAQVFLAGNKNARFAPLFAVICLHNFFSSLLPSRVGELSYIYLLRKTKIASVGEGISTLAFSRLMDGLAVALFFVVVSLTASDTPGIMKHAVPYVGFFFALIFIMGAAAILSRRKATAFLEQVQKKEIVHRSGALTSFVEKIRESLESVRSFSSWRVLLTAFCFSIFIWAGQYAISFIIMRGLGIDLPFSLIILGSGLIALTSIIPVQGVAGFGTTEGAWTVAFLAYGLDPATSIISGFVLHIVQILFFIILGCYGMLWLFLKRRAQGDIEKFLHCHKGERL